MELNFFEKDLIISNYYKNKCDKKLVYNIFSYIPFYIIDDILTDFNNNPYMIFESKINLETKQITNKTKISSNEN